MSKYKGTKEQILEEQLKDLTTQLENIQEEKRPLEAHEKAVKSQIKDVMGSLGLEESGKLKIKETVSTRTNLEGLLRSANFLKDYLVVVVDEKETLKIMYENHVNISVAKKTLRQALDKNKYSEVVRKDVHIKNR